MDIMREQPDLILGSDKLSGIQKLLSIYGDIAGNKKLYNEAVAAKLKDQVGLLKGDPFFQQNASPIWQSLTQKQRDSLTEFMK